MFKLHSLKKFDLDFIFLAVLLVGISVRFWGISFCLPNRECRPDETAIVSHTLKFFSGDLNPHFFSYPTLYLYILFGFYLLYFLIGKALGRYDSTSELMQEFAVDPTNLYLIDRYLSACLGTATIFVLYKLVETLFGRKTAVISSVFLSLAYLHVRDSHFGVTDVAFTFFVVLSVFYIVNAYEEKTVRSYIIAGVLIGITTSVKYPGSLLICPMFAVHLFNFLNRNNSRSSPTEVAVDAAQFINLIRYPLVILGVIALIAGVVITPDFAERYLTLDGSLLHQSRLQSLRLLSVALGCGSIILPVLLTRIKFLSDLLDQRFFALITACITAFFLGSPFALIDFRRFVSDFFGTYDIVSDETGLDLGAGWWYHLRFTLPLGLGWALFFAALIGILIIIRLNLKKALILLAFPALYYLTFGKAHTVMLRYMLPMVPFLCMAAAVSVNFICKKLDDRFKSPLAKEFAPLFLTTLLLCQSAYQVVQCDRLLAVKDNRLVAAEWMQQNTPGNSSVYQTGSAYGHLELDQSPEFLEKSLIDLGAAKLSATQLDSPQISATKTYAQWAYDDQLKQFFFRGQSQSALPEYIIQQTSPLAWFSKIEPEVAKILDNSYSLKASFAAIRLNNAENWFNQQDAFYLPFTGFKDMTRPGPNFYIYQRLSQQSVSNG